RIMVFHERLHGRGKFFGRRGSVICKRNAAKRKYDFGQNGFVYCKPGHGKSSTMRRMGVANGSNIRTLSIDQKVHGQL
ncbi:hypothetical protein OFN64_38365, partial [Escherichia coli]|nr:hypothetical protein [Escherichia coli]